MIVEQVIYLLALLCARLPLRALRAMGALVGEVSYRLNLRSAKTTRRNLEMCFPQMPSIEREKLARTSLHETGKTVFEIPWVWLRPHTEVRARTSIQNPELLRDKLAVGKGVIVLAPHLGNWEVLGLYLAEAGPTTSLYKPPKHTGLEKLVRSARQKTGATLVPTNRAGVAALLKALKQGHITGILPDQEPDEDGGVFADFFDVPALSMTLVSGLMQRTGCSAVTGFARRTAQGFEIVFGEPPAALSSDDKALSVAALNTAVESCVVRCPAQYQWEYKRFKSELPGTAKRYKNMR